MENNSKKIKDIFSEELQRNTPYPERYRYFDDEYLRKNLKFIKNSSIKKKLQRKILLAKLYFDYKRNHSFFDILLGDFSYLNNLPLDFLDAIACFHIFLEIENSILKISNEKIYYHYNDNIVLKNYHLKFIDWLDCYFRFNILEEDFYSCFHPFIRKILINDGDNIFDYIKSDEYKTLEMNFTRLADYEKKQIKDLFRKKFVENEKIFVCRFDIICRGSRGSYLESYGVSDFKKQLKLFFDFIRNSYGDYFESGLEVIFPSKIISKKILTHHFPIGQVVLIATKKLNFNKKILKSFASATHAIGILDFQPAAPFSKELGPRIDGFLEFTPSTLDAIDLIAEFLTLERRYVSPPNLSSPSSGRPHCFQIVNIKP